MLPFIGSHPSLLRLGPVHLAPSGLCAAVGLVAALLLTQRTARRIGLDAAAVWDAALVALLAAFVASRLLLVASNLRGFLATPLLVLTLPAIDDTGLLLAAMIALLYIRRRRLSLLGFLDAIAPSAALAWAFFSLGALLDGSRNGMPLPGGSAPYPVEFITLIAAMVICGELFRSLRRRPLPGRIAACALMLAGGALFLLDFVRLPADPITPAILDPVQWLGLGMVVTGFALRLALPTPSRSEEPNAF